MHPQMHPCSAAAALCSSNLACQIVCRELSLTRTLPFRSPKHLERFYLSVPKSKVCSWGAGPCRAAYCWEDVTIQQLRGVRDLGNVASQNRLLQSSRASPGSGCSSALLPASYGQGKGEGMGPWLAAGQSWGTALSPACLCPACAEGKGTRRGQAGLWRAIPHGTTSYAKKAGSTQASLPKLSPCEPSPVLTPQLSFLASQVRATQPARIHLSPSLSFLLPSSPGIQSLLNWSHQSPSGFPACLRQVVTHVLGSLISAPSLASHTGRALRPPRAVAGLPIPWQGKQECRSPEREGGLLLSFPMRKR